MEFIGIWDEMTSHFLTLSRKVQMWYVATVKNVSPDFANFYLKTVIFLQIGKKGVLKFQKKTLFLRMQLIWQRL